MVYLWTSRCFVDPQTDFEIPSFSVDVNLRCMDVIYGDVGSDVVDSDTTCLVDFVCVGFIPVSKL